MLCQGCVSRHRRKKVRKLCHEKINYNTIRIIYLDTLFCVIRRAFDKQNIFQPHKLHLFQRLNRNGLSHWQVSLLYMSTILLLALSFILGGLTILIITFFVVLIFGFYLDRFIAVPFSN